MMHLLTTRTSLTLAALASLGLVAAGAHAQSLTPTLSNSTTLSSFTAGDLVISRVNDGSVVGGASGTVSGTSAPVYLDEYTTTGLYQGTFALPASGTNAFSLSDAATSEGALTLSSASANGAQVLTIAGYNAASGTAAIAGTKTTGNGGTVNRTVDAVSNNGTGTMISQGPTDFSANNIRSAVSTDGSGTTIYANGATTGIVETNGGTQTTVSTTNTNERVLNIANGNLYYSTGSGGATGTGIYQVGTGLPTTAGTTSTQFINTTTNPYDFYFANANTVYVADNSLGLEKYTSATGAAGSFTLAYSSTAFTGLTGLTAVTNAAGVTTLYGVADAATSGTATATAVNNNTLYSFTDTGAAVGSTALVRLNTAADGTSNYAFRGLDFAPTTAANGVSAAPEPSQLGVLALVSLGLGGLILRARKRSVPQAA